MAVASTPPRLLHASFLKYNFSYNQLEPIDESFYNSEQTDQSSIQRRTRRIISRAAEARATRGYRTRANTADTPSRRDLTIHTTVAGMCGQEGDYTDDYNNYPATIYLNESFPRSDEGY